MEGQVCHHVTTDVWVCVCASPVGVDDPILKKNNKTCKVNVDLDHLITVTQNNYKVKNYKIIQNLH